MTYIAPNGVKIKRIKGKGRGVFTTCPIPRGTTIEKSPVVVIPDDELGDVLGSYVYGNGANSTVIGLGYLSMYNHSRKPNAAVYDSGRRAMEVIALRNIEHDEEVTINYGSEYRKAEWY